MIYFVVHPCCSWGYSEKYVGDFSWDVVGTYKIGFWNALWKLGRLGWDTEQVVWFGLLSHKLLCRVHPYTWNIMCVYSYLFSPFCQMIIINLRRNNFTNPGLDNRLCFLQDDKSATCFLLHCQKFIELVRVCSLLCPIYVAY